MLTIKIQDKGAAAKLNALRKAAGNMEPVFATVGRVLVNRIRLCFKLGIDPWGSPWAALKMRKGQPLVDTGRLRSSITSRPDSTGVTVGTNVEYASTHQFGARMGEFGRYYQLFRRERFGVGDFRRYAGSKKGHPIPWGNVPARPFLPIRKGQTTIALPPAWSAQAAKAIKTYLLKATAES